MRIGKKSLLRFLKELFQWNSFAYWWHYMIWKYFFKHAFYIYSKFCFYIHGKGLQKPGYNIYLHIILCNNILFSSGAVMSDTLQPHGLQHTRLPCPSPASLSITNSQSLLKLMFIRLVMPSNHLILCWPFFSCLQSFPASGSFPMPIAKYWSFSFSIISSSEYSVLPMISFKIYLFVLLVVQGTRKSLLNTIVHKHQFFGTQLLYSPTLISIHV